jgi:hypothetical protein
MRLLALAVTALLACTDTTSPLIKGISPYGSATHTISDANNGGGRPGFTLLPPLVAATTPVGTFDPGVAATARICTPVATCSTVVASFAVGGVGSSAITVDVPNQRYAATWATPGTLTLGPDVYRLEVWGGGALLGYADLYVVTTAAQLRTVPPGYAGVVRGSSLAIRFRIATGTVGVVDVTPPTASIYVGGTQGFTATVRDLYGNPIGSPPTINWTSSNPAVATVSPTTGANTTATGLSAGSTQITATSGGGTGSATLTVNATTAPTAQPDTYGVNFAGPTFVLPAPGLLGNDNLGVPAATLVSFGGGSLGGSVTDNAAGSTVSFGPGNSLTVNADGSLTFVHGANFTSDVTFLYRISNVAGVSDALVTLSVQRAPDAVNDGPSGSSSPGQAYHTAFNTAITIPGGASPSILANDDLGVPAATVVSFGGGSLGGTVADHAAGSSASGAAGTITIASDGTLTYTPANGFTGLFTVDYQIQNVAGSDAATITIAVGDRPSAANDTYSPTLYGNVPVNTTISTQFSVLTNDAGSGLVATVVGSPVGGSVALDPNTGKFTFTPNLGFSGAASFQYTISNGFGSSGPATVSLTVGTTFAWFVDGSVAVTGDGRYSTPFKTLPELASINNGAPLHPKAGDLLFLYENATAYTGPITLLANQKLTGQDATTTLASIAGPAWPADAPQPVMNSGNSTHATITSGSGDVVLGAGNTLDGFTLGTATGTALVGTSFGTLTVADVSVSTSGQAINLTTGSVSGSFDAVTSTGGLHNIALTGVSGGATGSFGSGALSGATDDAFVSSGGAGTLSYSGTISNSVVGKYAVNVSTRSGGSLTLGGSINPAGAGSGVVVKNNTAGSVTFSGASMLISVGTLHGVEFSGNSAPASLAINSGGLNVTTTTGSGVQATGAGTLEITGAGNALLSAGGIALNVANVTIGTNGLNFRSISANGGSNGISLVSTGTTGGLTVTGDGATTASGGTIQNTIGADGATGGNGIYLSATNKVALRFMSLNDHQNNGLFAQNVSGLDLLRVRFTGNNGTSNSGVLQESAVHLVNASGGVTIKNSLLNGGAFDGVVVQNSTLSPVLDSLVFAFDTVTSMQGSLADVRNTALQVLLSSGSADVRMRDNYLTYWWALAIQVAVSGSASATARIQNNQARQTSGAVAGAGGIWVSGGNLAYNISSNVVTGTNGTAISADKVLGGVNLNGTIANNTIGTSGVPNSGSGTGIAIFASHTGSNVTTTRISNNLIRQINGSASGAITVITGDDPGGGGSGTMNATVTGNDIQESGTTLNTAQQAILVTHGRVTGDTDLGCYDIGGAGALRNNIVNFNTAAGGANVNRIRSNERFLTTARLPGYVGANNDNVAVGNYLLGRNTASNASIVNNVASGGGGYTNTTGGAPCTQPSM